MKKKLFIEKCMVEEILDELQSDWKNNWRKKGERV